MARKGDTNPEFSHGAGPLEGDTLGQESYTDNDWNPRDVGEGSKPRLYGPGLGNPYGVSDFEGTTNVSDSRKHELNKQRILGAIQMKGEDVDPAQFYGPEPVKVP